MLFWWEKWVFILLATKGIFGPRGEDGKDRWFARKNKPRNSILRKKDDGIPHFLLAYVLTCISFWELMQGLKYAGLQREGKLNTNSSSAAKRRGQKKKMATYGPFAPFLPSFSYT